MRKGNKKQKKKEKKKFANGISPCVVRLYKEQPYMKSLKWDFYQEVSPCKAYEH